MLFEIMSENTSRKPCEKAVARYGEWRECKRRAFFETSVVGCKSAIPTYSWYELRVTILESPDSDTKRNARLEGDFVVWEQRYKQFYVEVNSLEELMELIKDGGELYCEHGKCHIEVFAD